MRKKVLMVEMTSPEFRAAVQETDTVILPVGSTEVLGTHGPLGTDFFVAAEIARRIGEKVQAIVAPAIPVGDALELRDWPGTLSIRSDVLQLLYLDICHSLIRHGIKRIFFINTHMMNMRSIDYCGRILRQQGVLVAQVNWWKIAFSFAEDLVETTESPYAHGGEVITSVIKALQPELVDLAQAVRETPKPGLSFHGNYTPTSGGPFYTYPDFSDYCDSGGWGDPGFATSEKGEILIERAITRIVEFLEEFKSLALPPCS